MREFPMATSRILIATPCYGGLVYINYMQSVIALLEDRSAGKPDFDLKTISIADLAYARNMFASSVIGNDTYSHVLFIDADTGFPVSLVAKMIAFNKPVVGSLVPNKSINPEQIFRAAKQVKSAAEMTAVMFDYVNANTIKSTETSSGESGIRVHRGFTRINSIGTGLLLVSREALLQIKSKFPELWLDDPGGTYKGMGHVGGILQCFSSLANEDGVFMSEDMSFIQRWTVGCGGEAWACVDEEVTHVGPYGFHGKYIDRLKAGLPQTNVHHDDE